MSRIYCTDTRYTDKYRRKETQHEHLQQTLRAQGFEVIVLLIILGFAGTIYKTAVVALAMLGYERHKAKKLLQGWHAHGVQTHHTIIMLRRKVEGTCLLSIESSHGTPRSICGLPITPHGVDFLFFLLCTQSVLEQTRPFVSTRS